MKVVALLVAGGLHATLAAVLIVPERAEVEGAGGTADVRLGTAFQDLVDGGVLASQIPSSDPIEPNDGVSARVINSLTTIASTKSTPIEEITASAKDFSRAEYETPIKSSTDAVGVASKALVATTLAHATGMEIPRTLTDQAKSLEPASNVALQTPAQVTEASPRLSPEAITQVLAAVKEPKFAPQQSFRPLERPERPERRPETPRTENRSPAPSAGNAMRNERAGSLDARADGTSATSGASGTRQATGNAASSNYPGEVMRCISRAARLNRSRGGTAVVKFRIDGSGQVNSVSLAASSGDARLDRAATRAIRRAGPCPRPPRGAQTRFSVRIK